jgi:hypothetical protein
MERTLHDDQDVMGASSAFFAGFEWLQFNPGFTAGQTTASGSQPAESANASVDESGQRAGNSGSVE